MQSWEGKTENALLGSKKKKGKFEKETISTTDNSENVNYEKGQLWTVSDTENGHLKQKKRNNWTT